MIYNTAIPSVKYDVEDLGCWKDTGNRAIPTIEGQDPLLKDSYQSRTNAKEKCLQATLKLGNCDIQYFNILLLP